MKYLKLLNRSQLIVLGSVVVACLCLVWLSVVLLMAWGNYRAEANDIEPKLSRLYGLAEMEQQFTDTLADVKGQLQVLSYPAEQETSALSTAMQQKMRRTFESFGLSVKGSQVLPEKEKGEFLAVRIRIDAVGSMEALRGLLVQLIEERPLVLVEGLEIKPDRRRNNDGAQSAVIEIYLVSYKLKS